MNRRGGNCAINYSLLWKTAKKGATCLYLGSAHSMREGASSDSATAQSVTDHIRATTLSLFVDQDIEIMSHGIEEYSVASTKRIEEVRQPSPLSTMCIPGYIRKVSAHEKNASAWVLRLGNSNSSE